jgi:hypothetical protein
MFIAHRKPAKPGPVTAVVVALACLAASRGLAAEAGPATPPDWPPGAPVAAAVLVRHGAQSRLALADLAHGSYRELASADEATVPVWSADGARLAFRAAKVLYTVAADQGEPVRVRDGLGTAERAPGGYALSPNGSLLAVATPRTLEIYATATAEPVAKLAGDLVLSHLAWSANDRLAACRWNGRRDASSRQSLALFDVRGGSLTAQPIKGSMDGCEILGLRQDHYVVKRRDADLIEEVVAVAMDGSSRRLRRLPADVYAQAYLAGPDAIVAAAGADDEGDATRLKLYALAGKSHAAWLRRFRHVIDLQPDVGGDFVLLTSAAAGDAKAGEIFLASADGKTIRRVLPAAGTTGKSVSFSHPTPRPSPKAQP